MTASDASAGVTKHAAQAARKVAGEAFTAAWAGSTSLPHHVTVGMLVDAYRSWKRSASAGIDGVTWQWRSVIDGPWERRAPARHQGTSSTGKKPRSAEYGPGLVPGAPTKVSRAIDAER